MKLVENAELVTAIFGEWPSFHDAEVVGLSLDRSGPEGPTLEVRIHVHSHTAEVSPQGHFVQKDHTLVTLSFHGVTGLHLEDFNHQNVLLQLDLAAVEDEGCRMAVHMCASYGLDAEFRCAGCRVTAVEPFDPRDPS